MASTVKCQTSSGRTPKRSISQPMRHSREPDLEAPDVEGLVGVRGVPEPPDEGGDHDRDEPPGPEPVEEGDREHPADSLLRDRRKKPDQQDRRPGKRRVQHVVVRECPPEPRPPDAPRRRRRRPDRRRRTRSGRTRAGRRGRSSASGVPASRRAGSARAGAGSAPGRSARPRPPRSRCRRPSRSRRGAAKTTWFVR